MKEGPISASASSDDKELLIKIRKHFSMDHKADKKQRDAAMADLEFAVVPGEQWDENQKEERGKRPCWEFNKIHITGKRIINAMRDSRPSGKVIGVEDNDKETAEIYEGLIRSIWSRGGDSIVDYAAEYQVFAGYGAWRVDVDYNDDDAFDQDISLSPIHNPFCLFPDANAVDILKRDATRWIFTEKIAKEEYEDKYTDRDEIDFGDHDFDDDTEWVDEKYIRVAEYWYHKPVERELWLLADGKTIAADSDDAAALIAEFGEERVVNELLAKDRDGNPKKRTVTQNEVWMCVVSGNAVLEQPRKWPGRLFPFIPVYGEYFIVDGKIRWNGITRFAKDAQRSYNISRTAIAESIAMAPQAKYWATPTQAEGLTDTWAEAHQKNFPWLPYNPDPNAPGPPQRMGGADVPIALIQESQLAAEEINMVTGIYQADVGSPNPAQSGRQELARQAAGNLATFNYPDNVSNAVEHTWRVMIDLIPQVYDAERSLRILGQDEAETYLRVNQVVGGETINDLTVGKYDVIVKAGPNFSTKRQEAAETYQAMMQGNPELFPMIGDLIMKAMDLPYSDDVAERLKALHPPAIQQLLADEQDMPPEVQAAMAQVNQMTQALEQQAAEIARQGQETEVGKSELETAKAELQTEVARFEAKVAKETAKLAKAEADLVVKASEDSVAGTVEAARAQASEEAQQFLAVIAAEVAQSLEAFQQIQADMAAAAASAVEEIKQRKDEKPRLKYVESERVDGKLRAVPVYDEEPTIQ